MNKKHRNYNISSNLIFVSVIISVISFIWIYDLAHDWKNIANGSFNISFIIGLGILARLGKRWVKYLLLAFFIIGLLLMNSITTTFAHSIAGGITGILQTAIQAGSIILLFLVPKDNKEIIEVTTHLNSLPEDGEFEN